MFGRNTTGYAVFEIIAVIALMIALAVAVVPPLLQSLREKEIERAQQDTESIGQAVLAFQRDVRQWPNAAKGSCRRGWLVGNASLGGGRHGLPDPGTQATGPDLQQASFPTIGAFGEIGPVGPVVAAGAAGVIGAIGVTGVTGNIEAIEVVGTMTDHLIRNAAAATDTLYSTSPCPLVKPGWNGPYLESVPLDPWGNPYLVTVGQSGSAEGKAMRPAPAASSADSSVVVLSAGPDGLIQTAAENVASADDLAGDDVGYVLSSWR